MNNVAVGINSVLRDLFKAEGWFDPDKFGVRLSENIAVELSRGFAITDAVAHAVRRTETAFFSANRGIKQRFDGDLSSQITDRGLVGEGLLGVIQAFKHYAQHELVSDLVKDQKEAPCRASLQTYLAGKHRTAREITIGAGRADIVLELNDTREVIEVKVWNGKQYNEDGLVELGAHIVTEGLTRGFYVVFEFFATVPTTPESEQWSNGDTAIDIVYVHIPLTYPSKLGREIRRRRRLNLNSESA